MEPDLLEHRVLELERLIIGDKTITTNDISKASVVDQLFELHTAISAAEKRSKIAKVLARTTEIQKYIDPHFLDNDVLSTESKIKLILAEEDRILEIAQALENIQSLSHLLNHPTFGAIDSLQQRLKKVVQEYTVKRFEGEEFLTQCRTLLHTYSQLMIDLSKLFAAWNQLANASKE